MIHLIVILDYSCCFGAFWSTFSIHWTEYKKKKSPLTWWKNPSWSSFLKVLLAGVCLLESCQWKCKRGEVSRLAVFCSLLFRLTLSGQPLRPVIQVVCSLCGAPPPPSASPPSASAVLCPQTCPASAAFSPEWWCLPCTNRKPLQLWAHRPEPMNNTCFSQAWLSMPIITPTLFGLCHEANPNT